MKENFFNVMKGIYEKLMLTSYLMIKNNNNNARILALTTPVQHHLVVLASKNHRINKGIQIRKEKVKLIFADNMILNVEDPKEYTHVCPQTLIKINK